MHMLVLLRSGAHAHLSCQGTMKFQHDLDKDLKFIHVFPRVEIIEAADAAGAAAVGGAAAGLIDHDYYSVCVFIDV